MMCHLIIPSLDLEGDQDLAEYAPSLLRLTSLGQQQTVERVAWEFRLSDGLGIKTTDALLPLAAMLRQYLGLSAQGNWLCASPVFLEVGIEKIILHAADLSELCMDESASLIETFNSHFEEDGLNIEGDHSGNWFIQIPEHRDIKTHPLSAVSGQSLYPCLPTGEYSAFWHRVLNETQMLFFNHPVNLKREQEGKRPINGLWLWGEGEIKEAPHCDWDLLVTDDVISKAIARFSGLDAIPLDQWHPGEDRPGRVMLMANDLAVMNDNDHQATQDLLRHWDRTMFGPLCRAWNQGALEGLIIESDEMKVSVPKRSRWQFWRRC